MIEHKLPLFRGSTIETDVYDAGEVVKGDFLYTQPYTNSHGLKFAQNFEIWPRQSQDVDFYSIDPDTLEISFDGGKTFMKWSDAQKASLKLETHEHIEELT